MSWTHLSRVKVTSRGLWLDIRCGLIPILGCWIRPIRKACAMFVSSISWTGVVGEWKCHVTFTFGNESSRERRFHGTFVSGNKLLFLGMIVLGYESTSYPVQ